MPFKVNVISKVVFVGALFFSANAFSAELAFLVGKVKIIKKDGESFLAQKGAEISFGDKVKTYNKAIALIKLDQGKNIKLNENSLARIQKPSATKAAVVLLKGSVFAKVRLKKKKDSF